MEIKNDELVENSSIKKWLMFFYDHLRCKYKHFDQPNINTKYKHFDQPNINTKYKHFDQRNC